MKKYILLIILIAISLPVFAVCSITGGACSTTSNWESKPLQKKYNPDKIQDLQRTDAFKLKYKKPYHDALINTDSDKSNQTSTNNYNSNCQFGVCLPSVEPDGDVLE